MTLPTYVASVTLNTSEQWIGASFALAPLPPDAVLTTPTVAVVHLTLARRRF